MPQAWPGATAPVGSSRCSGEDMGLELLKECDGFMMSHCKVIPCNKGYPHDWSRCPFAHPTEASRRRDPRVHPHSGVACPRLKKEGRCDMGDSCPFAHSIFEYWLHPTRYRTQLCKDGAACRRSLCFFAHSLEELRLPDSEPAAPSAASLAAVQAAVAANKEAGLEQLAAFTLHPSAAASSAVLFPSQTGALPNSTAGRGSMCAGGVPQRAQQERRQWQQEQPAPSQGQAELAQLVLQLLRSGQLSADKAAAVLREVLPPSVLSSVQTHLLASAAPGAGACCMQPTSGTSPPVGAVAAAPYVQVSALRLGRDRGSDAGGLGWPVTPTAHFEQLPPWLSTTVPEGAAQQGQALSLQAAGGAKRPDGAGASSAAGSGRVGLAPRGRCSAAQHAEHGAGLHGLSAGHGFLGRSGSSGSTSPPQASPSPDGSAACDGALAALQLLSWRQL